VGTDRRNFLKVAAGATCDVIMREETDGSWFPKLFPDPMAKRLRIRTPGHVYQVSTPPETGRIVSRICRATTCPG